MSHPSHQSNVSTALTLTLFVIPIIYLTHRQKRLSQKRQAYNAERAKERAFLHNLTLNPSMQPLRPPLPDVVRNILGRCRFAYLSTMDLDANSSHLSLMRFTYLAEEELSEWYTFCLCYSYFFSFVRCSSYRMFQVLMSTNVYTKKYEMLEKQNGVALLIHDFSDGGSTSGSDDQTNIKLTGEYSITLNGTCSVVKDGKSLKC
jgi:hypothetical protein